ncbi:MAG TPA: hypothetical protein VN802_03630 [Stellaceae bacterium]|nr:hypothetical protein [Stellaceae bacterium]
MSDAPEIRKLPSTAQRAWLRRGLDQPGGKLPLFDESGQQIDTRTIRACIEQGWAEPWFANPLKPNWLVCKLTENGRTLAGRKQRPPARVRKNRPSATITPIR